MMNWTEVADLNELRRKGKLLFRRGSSQIVLFAVDNDVFAIDNRCPHEGYPLIQGDIDPGKCTLTCQWHNWKFDLRKGDALVGQDAVRTYPVRLENDKVEVDLSPADPQKLRSDRLNALKTAFGMRQYGRAARELARMHFQGLDPLDALRAAIDWSNQRLEFGMTHAHAAMADWLTLAKEGQSPEAQLIPVLESFDHLSLDVLGRWLYPYSEEVRAYAPDALLAAISAEDEPAALALLNGAIASGLTFEHLLPVLSRAALAHHLDFGHSLIYVQKTQELIQHLGPELTKPLCQALIRSIFYATREDLLPEFKGYAPALAEFKDLSFGSSGSPPPLDGLLGANLRQAFAWVLSQAGEHAPEAIFSTLLQALAHSLLHFDQELQFRREVTVDENIGWLDLTHGLTFAHAVHVLCGQQPALWPEGLMQMALFYGRNTPYVNKAQEVTLEMPSAEAFWPTVTQKLLDHGCGLPVIAAHYVKTALAVRQEASRLPEPDQLLLKRALWRYLHGPAKQKHLWRTMYQSLNLIRKDY